MKRMQNIKKESKENGSRQLNIFTEDEIKDCLYETRKKQLERFEETFYHPLPQKLVAERVNNQTKEFKKPS